MPGKKGKINKIIKGNMSILYVTIIIALGAMGIGYGVLMSDLSIDMSIKTGHIKGRIEEISSLDLDLEEGEWITFRFSEDNQTLYVEGVVYPEFNKKVNLKIIDEGNIPSSLKDIHLIDDNGSTTLTRKISDAYIDNSYLEENIVEFLHLNINPSNNNQDNYNEIQRDSFQGQDDISNFQDRIYEYNLNKDYEFEYELLLEQSL